MKKLAGILLALTCLHVAAQQPGGYWVAVTDAPDAQAANNYLMSLTQAGYECRSITDASGNGVVHVAVGPFSSQQQADAVRSSFIAAGYHLPGMPSTTAAATPTRTATPSALEAEALRHLGGDSSAASNATGADLEAQANAALKRNEAEQEAKERQAAADRAYAARRAAAQAEETASDDSTAPAQESTTSSVMDALTNGLNQLSDTLAQQNAEAAARNADAMAQAQAQVEANNARRQAEGSTEKSVGTE